MLDHAREAVEMSCHKKRSDLDSDRKLNLALVRLVEVVGEAAARISKDVQNQHPAIRWAEIISLRNRLIHGYDSVDLDILWTIIQSDLPELILQLEEIVTDR